MSGAAAATALVGRTCADEAEAAARLQQQEQDLLLAAQLGQALLAKNEQLSRENERRAAEYAAHLEALEQERHSLRLQMSAMQVEHDNQVLQLQADIKTVREQIERQQHSGKDTDKQRSQILDDLTEQNQRLTRQLREAAKGERQLQQQVEQLRQQQQLRTNTFEFHTSSVDTMRAEIVSLSEQREDLERRLRGMLEERNQLISGLQETSERQLVLERERQERSGEVRGHRRRAEELAAANSSLSERLETAAGLSPLRPQAGLCHTLTSTGLSSSLRHELDSSVDEGIGSGTTGSHLASVDVTMADVTDVECDDPLVTSAELAQLRREVADTTAQMQCLEERVRRRAAQEGTEQHAAENEAGEDATMVDSASEQVAPGRLQDVFAALEHRMLGLLPAAEAEATLQDGCCTVCGRPRPTPLETQLAAARHQLQQLQHQHQLQNSSLQQLADELERHNRQMAMRGKQYTALQEEKSMLKSQLDEAYVAKEDLVRQAWEARDQAVERKNGAELELSRVRIDVLQANSQLLESVQCKVRLSCQLDEWQWDMQQLVDSEIKEKLHKTERRRSSGATPAPPTRGGALRRFFGRS